MRDASEFAPVLHGHGRGDRRLPRAAGGGRRRSRTRIAAFLLYLRDPTGKRPHAYFGWTEGNPLKYLARFILFGEGDIAPVTREIPAGRAGPERRPAIHVG